MSFGDDTLDPSNADQHALEKALELLQSYLKDFPEHDQGDIRVWSAAELLGVALHRKKISEKRTASS